MNENGNGDEEIVLFGVESSYASDIAESAVRHGKSVRSGIFITPPKYQVAGIGEFIAVSEIPPGLTGAPTHFCEVVPGRRHQHVARAKMLEFESFPVLADPSAVISPSAILERGCYVNALSVVASHAELGRHVFVGRNCSVGHHSRLAQFCTLGPGVNIASHCAIERGAFIGTGATIAPSMSVGANSVVGAGAVVIADVPDNCVVVGNPARVIREKITGYMDVGI